MHHAHHAPQLSHTNRRALPCCRKVGGLFSFWLFSTKFCILLVLYCVLLCMIPRRGYRLRSRQTASTYSTYLSQALRRSLDSSSQQKFQACRPPVAVLTALPQASLSLGGESRRWCVSPCSASSIVLSFSSRETFLSFSSRTTIGRILSDAQAAAALQ
jgi:hypothetical protein